MPNRDYFAEVGPEEKQLIAVALTMASQIIPRGVLHHLAAQFLAEAPMISYQDVQVVCSALSAMARVTARDRVLPRDQRELVVKRVHELVQKLERGTSLYESSTVSRRFTRQ